MSKSNSSMSWKESKIFRINGVELMRINCIHILEYQSGGLALIIGEVYLRLQSDGFELLSISEINILG